MSRVFVSFAIEDAFLRDSFVGQGKNAKNAISFIDYSVKQAWDSSWKTQCRARIKTCRGVVGIITRNTPRADGQLWELKCAYEEGIPVLLIHGHSSPEKRVLTKPSEISNRTIYNWTHDNIINFLNSLS